MSDDELFEMGRAALVDTRDIPFASRGRPAIHLR